MHRIAAQGDVLKDQSCVYLHPAEIDAVGRFRDMKDELSRSNGALPVALEPGRGLRSERQYARAYEDERPHFEQVYSIFL